MGQLFSCKPNVVAAAPPPPPPFPAATKKRQPKPRARTVNPPTPQAPLAAVAPLTLQLPNPPVSQPPCAFCKIRPRYSEGAKTFSYCGLTCREKAKAKKRRPRPRPAQPLQAPDAPVGPIASTSTPDEPQSPDADAMSVDIGPILDPDTLCLVTDCNRQAILDDKGLPSYHCAKHYHDIWQTGCISCREVECEGPLCSQCDTNATNNAPMLIKIPDDHAVYENVERQFLMSWRHTNKQATVNHIYKIILSQALMDSYNTHQGIVETSPGRGFMQRKKPAGNQHRRWHGTTRECTLGDNENMELCDVPACALCSILRHSFDIMFFKGKTGWGRFGKGIYTSSTSSKADDYSTNKVFSHCKAVLLNKVIVGKGYKMVKGNQALTAAPVGYDSVLGEKGGDLNYDELVVYNNDAIRPSYLVIYTVIPIVPPAPTG